MRPTPIRVAAVLSLLALISARADAASVAGLPADAEKVARDFLVAFSMNDRESIQKMLPNTAANLYGPCPFRKMPQISKARADARVAAVNFEGPMTDPNLPTRGIVLLRLVEEGKSKSWRVRQLYWFNELPSDAEVPDESPTAADRKQEPAVRRAAMDFISAWLARKWEKMGDLTFQWWKVHRRPPRSVKLANLDVEGRPTTLDGLRVDFTAKLRFAGILSRRVRGNVWLVKEDGYWRVRPITFSLMF